MVDIKKWQDRIENLLQVQKDLCLEQIITTFTRNELIELRLLLNEMMEIKNNNRATAVTVAESEDIMYYLTITAKRKNAKRHIVTKSESLDELRNLGKNNMNDEYIVEIYTGKWELVERVK